MIITYRDSRAPGAFENQKLSAVMEVCDGSNRRSTVIAWVLHVHCLPVESFGHSRLQE